VLFTEYFLGDELKKDDMIGHDLRTYTKFHWVYQKEETARETESHLGGRV
jgi:hypothetical protein